MSAKESDEVPDIPTLHTALIDKLKSNQNLTTDRVEAAFRVVPRHLFLPYVPLERAYSNTAIPTKFENGRAISSSSQPSIMAIMLEQLDLQPCHRVLEIGAGTGYNAALMAHLVGGGGHVTTVDLDEDTVAEARAHLSAAGFEQVDVVQGDGMLGYAANAPYDRIILTVGGWDLPSQWLEQLAPDGRILLPLSLNGPQLSVAFDRDGDHLVSVSSQPCGFMRIRGQWADPQISLQISSEPDMGLELNDYGREIDTIVVHNWLYGPSQDYDTGVEVRPGMLWRGLSLWLALRESQTFSLGARGEEAGESPVPHLFGDGSNWVATFGLLSAAGLTVLMRPPDTAVPPLHEEPPPFTLLVRSFGRDKNLTQRLIGQIRAWDEAGQPDTNGLRIRVYPAAVAHAPTAGEFVIVRDWRQFVLDWP